MREEIEANEFAMCLLMPENLIRKYLAENPLEDFSDIEVMAKEFQVLPSVMALRLQKLNLIKY